MVLMCVDVCLLSCFMVRRFFVEPLYCSQDASTRLWKTNACDVAAIAFNILLSDSSRQQPLHAGEPCSLNLQVFFFSLRERTVNVQKTTRAKWHTPQTVQFGMCNGRTHKGKKLQQYAHELMRHLTDNLDPVSIKRWCFGLQLMSNFSSDLK
jgi:hypothetical protein